MQMRVLRMDTAERRPLKTRSHGWAQALAAGLARAGVSPDAISVASVGFAVGATTLLWLWPTMVASEMGQSVRAWVFIGAATCVQLRLLCNLLDGLVAVEHGRGGKLGALYNEVPDRLADVLFLVGAGYAARELPYAVTLGWAAAVLAVGAAYVRQTGAALGLGHDFCGPCAKPHRMFLLTVTLVAAAWLPPAATLRAGLAVIVVGTALTCVRRLWRMRVALLAR